MHRRGGSALRPPPAVAVLGLALSGCVSDRPGPQGTSSVSPPAATPSAAVPTATPAGLLPTARPVGGKAIATAATPPTAADLTIELSIADAAGGSLGTVLDTAGVVSAGQQATMIFEVFVAGAQKAEITKVSCT